ncbi:MAG TPA: outer membrane lipoprotein-sorting protein, partial [Alphaproteobacteria bacterium]|nr:outer membrane lipoprotein-sorting protein [Alphaproteobacteria bacterium]
MMIRLRIASLAAMLVVLLAAAPAFALTALEVMQRVDARDDGDNMTARQEMILIDKNKNRRVREMTMFAKDEGRDTRRLVFFLSPANVKHTGFLTYDYYAGDKDDDQWLYLPALRKTKRIASSDKSAAFMGSDFSYADMTRRVISEWKFKILKEAEVRGKPVWLIQALPASEVIRKRYGYDKSVVFVHQDLFMVVRAVHWVSEGDKLKYLDMKTIENIDGIWTATEINVKTTKARKTLH